MPTYEPEEEEEVPPLHKKGFIELGRTADGDLYKFGRVIVEFDKAVLYRVGPVLAPVSPVLDFFADKGYAPKLVLASLPDVVIEIGECVDVVPMLDELKSIPGVIDAEPDMVHPLHVVTPWLE